MVHLAACTQRRCDTGLVSAGAAADKKVIMIFGSYMVAGASHKHLDNGLQLLSNCIVVDHASLALGKLELYTATRLHV